MKTITKFEADDGTLWDEADKAEARDQLVRRLREIEAPLGPRVARQHERARHPLEVVHTFKRRLVELCAEQFPTQAIFQGDPLTIHPFSIAGRIVDDSGPAVLNHVWQRLMCIAPDGYEYEQPYFALNPGT